MFPREVVYYFPSFKFLILGVIDRICIQKKGASMMIDEGGSPFNLRLIRSTQIWHA